MKYEDFKIVRELYPETQGLFWKTRKCPAVDFARETAWAMAADGEVTALADARACDAAVAAGHRVFALASRKMPFSRTVAAVCTEGEWTWNYVMTGEFEIVSPPKFLRRWAAADGACGVDGLSAGSVANGLWTDLEIAARDQIRALHRSGTGRNSVDEIETKGVIPCSAWRGLFAPMAAAESGGCAVNVTYARFVSPDRDCERRRLAAAEAQRRLEEQERRAYAAAVNERTQGAELDRIDHERQLARLEFEARQAEYEAAIQKQKIDAELYAKRRFSELEVALLRAKNEEEIRKAEALRAGDAAAAAATEEKIGAMSQALGDALARIAKALENLTAMNVSAEEISSWRPPASLSGEAARQYASGTDRFEALLGGIGVRAREDLVLTWAAERVTDGCATRSLMSAQSRDLVRPPRQGQGGGATYRNVLRIGDLMTLRLQSAKSGYLTLLNLGTSGKVTKLFPDSATGSNFIRAGHAYCLPGELMDLPSWIEDGPASDEAGYPERILAILTESPVELDENCLGTETQQAMTRGGFAAVEEAVAKLVDLEEGSWSFGLMEAWVGR